VLFATLPATAALAAAAPREIVIEGERIFPGSITATRDGAVIVGSVMTGKFYRAEPGAALAREWVPTKVAQGIFGILADDRSGTLWACATPLRMGPPAANAAPPTPTAAVMAYDLTTGVVRNRYPLPEDACGDIALGPDGSVYATSGAQVVRLKPSESAFRTWAGGPGAWGAQTMRLNAIAFAQGKVVVGVRDGSGLMSVEVRSDGSAGPPQAVQLDQPVMGPDGMRSFGANGILIPEQGAPGGRFTLVTLTPQGAQRTVLKTGFPDGPISTVQVGEVAYVLEGQVEALRNPNAKLNPFHAVAVDLPR
jgi:hypothetical protein